MNILEEIVNYKEQEVQKREELYPIKLLEESLYFQTKTVSLRHYLSRPDKNGIIAEIKRRSPSRGIINSHIDIEKLSIGYMQAGASALSVLTDKHFFGGSNHDLVVARRFNFCPILRKEFIISEYQIVESKSIGADAILLIAAILDLKEIKSFCGLAKKLGLEVLFEIHDEADLKKLVDEVDIVGVNNRDLNTFHTDFKHALAIAPKLPEEKFKIAESGLESPEIIKTLKDAGYKGFLIGEAFMKESEPDKACFNLISKLKAL